MKVFQLTNLTFENNSGSKVLDLINIIVGLAPPSPTSHQSINKKFINEITDKANVEFLLIRKESIIIYKYRVYKFTLQLKQDQQ